MKSEQSFLVKIWLAPLPSIRSWVQYQGISSSFLSCIAINKGELLFPVTFLTDCLLMELTFGQAERENWQDYSQPQYGEMMVGSWWTSAGWKKTWESEKERQCLYCGYSLTCPSLHTTCYLILCLKLVGGSSTQEWVDEKSRITLSSILAWGKNKLVSHTTFYLPFSPAHSHRFH